MPPKRKSGGEDLEYSDDDAGFNDGTTRHSMTEDPESPGI